jgi:hypothetical protein
MRASELLVSELEQAYSMLRERLNGLTDEEFCWAPVEGDVWTVRRVEDDRWAADYSEPDPVPAPFTTIGWRVVHVLECKLMYDEYAFGEGRLTWDDLSSPHDAETALERLDANHGRLIGSVRSLSDVDLERDTATNWGERWPTWKVVWTLIHHDLWHGGEIGALRDLYGRMGPTPRVSA